MPDKTPTPEVVTISVKVTITINGRDNELSWEGAKTLRDKLDGLLGLSDVVVNPVIHKAS